MKYLFALLAVCLLVLCLPLLIVGFVWKFFIVSPFESGLSLGDKADDQMADWTEGYWGDE